jgi:hypothetical protein
LLCEEAEASSGRPAALLTISQDPAKDLAVFGVLTTGKKDD